MESNLTTLLFPALVLVLPCLVLLIWTRKSFSGGGKLPPGPPGWPVFGHMFKLGMAPHATMARWKEKYGPVILLKLGSNNTLVILSASTAEELFKNHDLSFGDRMLVETMKSYDYYKSSLALAPYGAHWRMLRRLCSMDMFVHSKINETVPIRRKCIDDMISWIKKEANNNGVIEIAHFSFVALFNIFGNLILSRDVVEPDSEMATEFFTAMSGIVYWCGIPNLADLFAWLKPFDPQGIRRSMDRDMKKLLDIVSGLIKERMKENQEGKESRKDFLDMLLEFEGKGEDEPEKLSEHNISVFILEMFLGGLETTSKSTEWAMAELLRHPDKLLNVKAEIQKVVGPNRTLEESDIENLPYLRAVVKETLRLHPPLPFLLPRRATKEINYMGYSIPKDTQVFVNVYAIGRDPEQWDDPLSFKPERFLGSKVDFRGQSFEFIPFGAGRRICAGLPLASRLQHLVLGSLLHQFNWKLEDHVNSSNIDMSEKMGITVRKLKPLRLRVIQ